MNEDKQIEKLNTLISFLEDGKATNDEVAQVFEVILQAISSIKDSLEQEIAKNKGIFDRDVEYLKDSLSKSESHLVRLIETSKAKTGKELDNVVKQIYKEVKSLKEMIPAPADFTEIERRVDEVEKKIPKIPEELKAEQVRDKLETLEGDERLDKAAIKGLDELEKKIDKAKGTTIFGGGLSKATADSYYVKYYGGGSNVYFQTTAPNNPKLYDEWVDIS